MRLVILESPYAGDVARNVAYARRAMADCLARGEAPIASHLLYTQPGVLDDDVPAQRRLGIDAGLAWGRVADAAVFYVDYGWSEGMQAAYFRHRESGMTIEERRIAVYVSDGPAAEALLRERGGMATGGLVAKPGANVGMGTWYVECAPDTNPGSWVRDRFTPPPAAQAQFRMRANDDNPTDADLLWGWV